MEDQCGVLNAIKSRNKRVLNDMYFKILIKYRINYKKLNDTSLH